MTLRGSTVRRHASKETLETEKETVTTDEVREENLYPDLQRCTDGDENEIVTEKKGCLMSSFLQYIPRLLASVRLIVLSTVLILVFHHIVFSEYDTENSVTNCEGTLHELYQQYPQHETLWKAINTTYKICTQRAQVGVITLLHNGNGSVADCLVNRIATSISKLVGVSKTGEYCSVDGRTAHRDYEIDSFLDEIMKQRDTLSVVIVRHLEQMDLNLVKKLHFICDDDPNRSNKAVVILMLKVETKTFIDQKLDALVHGKLQELWGGKLEGSRLSPIIGRITNIVGGIDENITTKCP